MGVSTVLYSAMADPDLQIKGLGGGGGLQKSFFGPSGLILVEQ